MIDTSNYIPVKETPTDAKFTGAIWALSPDGELVIHKGAATGGYTFIKNAVRKQPLMHPVEYGGKVVGEFFININGNVQASYFGNNPKNVISKGFSKNYSEEVEHEDAAKKYIVLKALDDDCIDIINDGYPVRTVEYYRNQDNAEHNKKSADGVEEGKQVESADNKEHSARKELAPPPSLDPIDSTGDVEKKKEGSSSISIESFLNIDESLTLSNVGYESEYQWVAEDGGSKPTIYRTVDERPESIETQCYAFKKDSQIAKDFIKYRGRHKGRLTKFDRTKEKNYTVNKFVPFPTSMRIYELFQRESQFFYVVKKSEPDTLVIVSHTHYLAHRTKEGYEKKGRAYLLSDFEGPEIHFAGDRMDKSLTMTFRATRSLWHEQVHHEKTTVVENSVTVDSIEDVSEPEHIQEDIEVQEKLPIAKQSNWTVKHSVHDMMSIIEERTNGGVEYITALTEAQIELSKQVHAQLTSSLKTHSTEQNPKSVKIETKPKVDETGQMKLV